MHLAFLAFLSLFLRFLNMSTIAASQAEVRRCCVGTTPTSSAPRPRRPRPTSAWNIISYLVGGLPMQCGIILYPIYKYTQC